MTYKEVPDQPYTYLVYRTTGFGDQGGEPIREHEIVYSSEDYDDCLAKGRAMFPRHHSGWTYDNFTINVNTSTDKGKQLFEDHRIKYEQRLAELRADPNVRLDTYKWDDFTLTVVHNPLYDDPSPIKDEHHEQD